jgi:vancomycin resistance protein YoaR
MPVAGKTEAEAVPIVESKIRSYYHTPVKFYKDDFEYEITIEGIAEPIDIADNVNNILAQEQQRPLAEKLVSFVTSKEVPYSPSLSYNEETLKELVEEWNDNLKVGAKNATLEMDNNKGLIVIPEQLGLEVDRDRTFAGLPQAIDNIDDNISLPIYLKEAEPRVLAKDLAHMGEISSFTTNFNTSEINRSKNLRLAASKINGNIIEIGEEFRFNEIVGKRTVESGYSDAMIIVSGKFEPGLGGGVCQVSSTLYNACLMAGLEISERHNHGLAVSYVQLGLDATVVYGIQDFRFINNTSSPIYIRALTNGGQLTISIYGNVADKKNVQLTHIVDRVINFTEVLEPKDDLAPGDKIVEVGGQPGYNVRAFQKFYDSSGALISTKQLSSDYYRPLNKVVLVGPDAAQTVNNHQASGNTAPNDDKNPSASVPIVTPVSPLPDSNSTPGGTSDLSGQPQPETVPFAEKDNNQEKNPAATDKIQPGETEDRGKKKEEDASANNSEIIYYNHNRDIYDF